MTKLHPSLSLIVFVLFLGACSSEDEQIRSKENFKSIKLNKNELFVNVGDSEILDYTIMPSNISNEAVVAWTTNKETIVKVENGIIKALKTGEANVIVTIKRTLISDTCKVTVNPERLQGIKFENSTKDIVKGETMLLNVTYIPKNAGNKKLNWSSSDESVAKVSEEGIVNAIAIGNCSIKAISEEGKFEALCNINVLPATVNNILFESEEFKIEIGSTKQINVTVLPENAENKNIIWHSANTSIASIDLNGVVKANAIGETIITAESEESGYKATCKIKVADLDEFVSVYKSSSSITIIDGFVTGIAGCTILNNSTHSIELVRFYITESLNNRVIFEITDKATLGILSPGKENTLGTLFNWDYKPVCYWEFKYNGKVYSLSAEIDDFEFPSFK